ncbi:MAG: DNA polymerase III subunit delta' [Gammaproteobacteria bacterium]|nr:DNA polymerase III subunit delta' [Gammaproteobacteria bacterium]
MFPWTNAPWQYLTARIQQQQIPHAILIAGPAGVGKLHFARAFAQVLICENPARIGQACGQCRACGQFIAHTHPDYIFIGPEDDSQVIKIDQIRHLREVLTLARHGRRHRVVVVNPAEAMTTAAANSLLKTLEEPPAQTLLVLVTHQPSVLPATLRSRCQRLNIPLPSVETACEWLIHQPSIPTVNPAQCRLALLMNEGAPLRSMEWLAQGMDTRHAQALEAFYAIAQGKLSPLAVAAQWLKTDTVVPLSWPYRWLSELIRIKSGQFPQTGDLQQQAILHKLAQQVDLDELFTLQTRITAILRAQGVALNQQLLYESVLSRWSQLTQPLHA